MNKNYWIAAVFLFFVIAAIYFGGGGDEEGIKNLLDQLEATAETQQFLKPLDVAHRMQTLKELVSEDILVEYHGTEQVADFKGYAYLRASVFSAAQVVSESALERFDTEIEFLSESSAQVTFRLIVEGILKGGERFRENFKIQLYLLKEGDWVVTKALVERIIH